MSSLPACIELWAITLLVDTNCPKLLTKFWAACHDYISYKHCYKYRLYKNLKYSQEVAFLYFIIKIKNKMELPVV